MEKTNCILCDSSDCTTKEMPNEYNLINCTHGFKFSVSDEIFRLPNETFRKVSNLIYERLLSYREKKRVFEFYYYDESEVTPSTDSLYVNLAPLLTTYPNNIIERTDRSLLNLSQIYPTYGSQVGLDDLDMKAFFCYSDDYDTEYDGMANFMIELGYLAEPRPDSKIYVITAKGWLRIEELKKKSLEVNQAFVAMSFGEKTYEIRIAFKKAIESCGYLPVFIDEKEHNNQIVPEIFYEISRSKFIVVDVAYPNYGAYYEAGFAQGLGKQVIVCCNKAIFDGSLQNTSRPHFDISQKSMVLWENDQELVEKLIRRIKSTII